MIMAFTGSAEDPFAILEEFNRSDATYLHLKTAEFELTLSRRADEPAPQERPDADDAIQVVADARAATDTQPDGTPTTSESHERANQPLAGEQPVPGSGSGQASDDNDHTVRAPMVGIFYAAPKPGESPFVTVGSEVEPDSTVGLLEAMKVFTAVNAETSGVVSEIFVQNGDFIEFDQPLLTVRTGGE